MFSYREEIMFWPAAKEGKKGQMNLHMLQIKNKATSSSKFEYNLITLVTSEKENVFFQWLEIVCNKVYFEFYIL